MPPRNLILISLDTLRFDALSAAPDRRLLGTDAELARTPALDAIAAGGHLLHPRRHHFPFHLALARQHLHGHALAQARRARPVRLPAAAGRPDPRRGAQRAGLAHRPERGRGWRNGDMFAMDSVGLNRGYDFQAFGGWLRGRTMAVAASANAHGPWYLFFHTMAVHRPYGKSHRIFRRLVDRDLKEKTPFHSLARLYLRNVSDVDRRFGRLWNGVAACGASGGHAGRHHERPRRRASRRTAPSIAAPAAGRRASAACPSSCGRRGW